MSISPIYLMMMVISIADAITPFSTRISESSDLR
uniref:Uncharacterized protein n=1 Tax=Rhizophora mucronata TaxID=61149 RepID=A0A2P2QZK3_RHIMU